jgi:thiol:disulfide interchange protein
MIPVNLAIIGAGAQSGSRARGFGLGAAYGAAIALVYGILGLVVVLTGATFGTLNASPWFNLVIALLFLVLGLAMVGVFDIDLSRLGSGIDSGKWQTGSYGVAFFMGGVAALLAGACVAPIVIAVLVLSATQYGQGDYLGLIYPFLLGLGMGLPWPFAGAGLAVLPKPGGWMVYVKYVFGAFILLLALYYGHLTYRLFTRDAARTHPVETADTEELQWHTDLRKALADAASQQRPLFIDFWATWCKNCEVMEKTTFRDHRILGALEPFVRLKYQAEDPDAPETAEILKHFGVLGLPTYVVLTPNTP